MSEPIITDGFKRSHATIPSVNNKSNGPIFKGASYVLSSYEYAVFHSWQGFRRQNHEEPSRLMIIPYRLSFVVHTFHNKSDPSCYIGCDAHFFIILSSALNSTPRDQASPPLHLRPTVE